LDGHRSERWLNIAKASLSLRLYVAVMPLLPPLFFAVMPLLCRCYAAALRMSDGEERQCFQEFERAAV
jgi:hypothetical protein